MNAFYSFILFSFIGRMLPVFVRTWAYKARYNAFWANHADYLAKVFAAPTFDYAEWTRSRALERDSIVLSVAQFKAKHNRAV